MIKIALKSLIKHNTGNKMIFLCLSLLFFIPVFLYGVTYSIENEIHTQSKATYGAFDYIFYRDLTADLKPVSNDEIRTLLPNLHLDSFGVFYTVSSHEIDGNRRLNMGFADTEALRLGAVTLEAGRFPDSDDEITLTRGNANALGVVLGQSVEIGEHTYIISGIVNDFGRFWVRGQLQTEQNISTTNTFVTEAHARDLYSPSKGVLQQIVLSIAPNIVSGSEDSQRMFANNARLGIAFKVPAHFQIIMYSVSLLTIVSVLILNKDKLLVRLKIYYLLGIEKYHIKFIVLFEKATITLLSLMVGFFAGKVAAHICLGVIFSQINIATMSNSVLSENLLLIVAMLAGFAVVFYFHAENLMSKVGLDTQDHSVKEYKLSEKRVSVFAFDVRKNLRTSALLTAIICLLSVFIAYGVTYRNYFTEEINPEAANGFIAKDYDFRFFTTVPSALPILDETPVFFTNSFELLGANRDFIEEIQSINGVSKAVAFRENTKMRILANIEQLDNYFGNITEMFGHFFNINEADRIRNLFGYDSNNILLNSEVVGYPVDRLEHLRQFVTDGEINIDKLLSGEEVILRVPAYKQIETNLGSFVAIGITPVNNTDPDAINFSMFQVGDEITLSGIMTNEFINGGVRESDLINFYRHDVTVRIGAIIRTFDDVLLSSAGHGIGVMGTSVITVNDAFDGLNIPARYSVINIYTDDSADNFNIADELEHMGLALPHMVFENWSSDIESLRIYNLLVSMFSIVFISILVVVGLILLASHLYIKTNISLTSYALFRINGFSISEILWLWFVQLFLISILGTILSIPSTIFLLNELMSMLYLRNFLSVGVQSMVILTVFLMVLISTIPSIFLLWKRKDNVIADVA